MLYICNINNQKKGKKVMLILIMLSFFVSLGVVFGLGWIVDKIFFRNSKQPNHEHFV